MPRDYTNVQVATICEGCGQLHTGEGLCDGCKPDYGASVSHEAAKLFDAPTQTPGQEFMDI